MVPRLLCLLVLLLEVRGLSLSLPHRKWAALAFYTQLSNLITAVSALLLVLAGGHMWTAALRYVSTCMLVMTFFVTVFVLIPMGGDPKNFCGPGTDCIIMYCARSYPRCPISLRKCIPGRN